MQHEDVLPDREVNFMIHLKTHGSYKRTISFLDRLLEYFKKGGLNKFGERGVKALQEATPKDTGLTSKSWTYQIVHQKGRASIVWSNNNVQDHVNIAIILQYGHATRRGTWVEGRDYINPAMRSVFDSISREAWEEMMRV